LASEGFSTITAFIWFLSCMNSLMLGKVRLKKERFSTFPAFVRLLSCVKSLM
ncbi:hypothetical protein DBR06_SOUSAS11710065, partial [Sousa chinensis]